MGRTPANGKGKPAAIDTAAKTGDVQRMHGSMAEPIIITGMHRSGTSLVASLLQEAGLSIGERLLGPSAGNRKGHFEDVDFVELHEDILADNGASLYWDGLPTQLRMGEDHQRRAVTLIYARRDEAL